jgi:hypothetical protein
MEQVEVGWTVFVGEEWWWAAVEVLAQLCLAVWVSGFALEEVELEVGPQEGQVVFSGILSS